MVPIQGLFVEGELAEGGGGGAGCGGVAGDGYDYGW